MLLWAARDRVRKGWTHRCAIQSSNALAWNSCCGFEHTYSFAVQCSYLRCSTMAGLSHTSVAGCRSRNCCRLLRQFSRVLDRPRHRCLRYLSADWRYRPDIGSWNTHVDPGLPGITFGRKRFFPEFLSLGKRMASRPILETRYEKPRWSSKRVCSCKHR